MNAPEKQLVEPCDGDAAEAGLGRGPVFFLISHSPKPCGVEMFARRLAQASRDQGTDARTLTIEGKWTDITTLWRKLSGGRALVVSLPIVAWKTTLASPMLALLFARLKGVRTVVVIHEWADLNPLRRALISYYLLFAQYILLSSPTVQKAFAGSLAGRRRAENRLVPIPPNIAPLTDRVSTPALERLHVEKKKGRLILGHFGSIYPKKQSGFVLDIASVLQSHGRDVFVVFIGDFIKARDDVESQFSDRVKALELADRVLVTGYVQTDAEIASLFDAVDVFVYTFSEGLTSRRGSVLACLQSGHPVVVNKSTHDGEFDHHPVFRRLIRQGAVHFVSEDATASDFAAAISGVETRRITAANEIFAAAWHDAADALNDSIG